MEDPVPPTGVNADAPLSKNALKKLKRKELKEEQMKEKMARKPVVEKEGEIDSLRYKESRLELLHKLNGEGKLNPWPHKFQTTMRLDEFVEKYEKDDRIKENDQVLNDEIQCIGGRVMIIRNSSRVKFYDVHGMLQKIQVVCNSINWKSTTDLAFATSNINRGDIIGITGFPGRTRSGELSIFATDLVLLSPCLEMLPKGPNAFSDVELRFRKRFLDFIMHKESRSVIVTRHKVIQYMRRFFYDRGFIEVETPIFNTVKGGATAKPFITHHNSLNRDLYLRIAPELYHKMLVVGGIERVFEIGKSFRNESIDLTHSPEFTSMECYCAYWDYEDQMKFCEELVSGIVKDITGSTKVVYGAKPQVEEDGKVAGKKAVKETDEADAEVPEPVTIDFTTPWARVSFMDAIEKEVGKFPRPLDGEEALAYGKKVLADRGLLTELTPPHTMNRILDFLCGEYVEGKNPNPVFVMDHPRLMSPLAKYHRADAELTERFEVHVAPFEIANAYTELNNPVTQRENFKKQEEEKKCDDEAMVTDETFCQSLEHALPPTGGLGIGIDRLVMLVTNTQNIKEVITFPLNRDE